MSSYKKLSKADITVYPYVANKQWSYTYTSASYPNDDIIYFVGTKEDFTITGSTTTNGQYQSLMYDSINHLFYQSYNDTLNTSSLMFDVNTYESASEQRPTSSYFKYNSNPLFINNFPTSSSDGIVVLNISKDIFGSKVLPYSFRMSSSLFDITDDGYGNLYNSTDHVGNIFYAHGMVVVTNSNYLGLFPPPTPPPPTGPTYSLDIYYSSFSQLVTTYTGSSTASLYYRIDSGSYSVLSSTVYETSCTNLGTIMIPSGSSVSLKFLSGSDNIKMIYEYTACITSSTNTYVCEYSSSPFTSSADLSIGFVYSNSGSGVLIC